MNIILVGLLSIMGNWFLSGFTKLFEKTFFIDGIRNHIKAKYNAISEIKKYFNELDLEIIVGALFEEF